MIMINDNDGDNDNATDANDGNDGNDDDDDGNDEKHIIIFVGWWIYGEYEWTMMGIRRWQEDDEYKWMNNIYMANVPSVNINIKTYLFIYLSYWFGIFDIYKSMVCLNMMKGIAEEERGRSINNYKPKHRNYNNIKICLFVLHVVSCILFVMRVTSYSS